MHVSLAQSLPLYYEVYCFDMELGSGASYEQYFVYSDLEQIHALRGHLTAVGLSELAHTYQLALQTAFEGKAPLTDEQLEDRCMDFT